MISGLCGFADLIRRNGGEVGAGELIDTARSLLLVDIRDRSAVEGCVRLNLSWASENPDGFRDLFASWFSGASLAQPSEVDAPTDELASVTIDADLVEAACIHTDDALAVEQPRESVDDGPDDDGGTEAATSEHGEPAPNPASGQPSADGRQVAGHGDLVAAPPTDAVTDGSQGEVDVVVELPDTPLDGALELARSALDSALEHRRATLAYGDHAPRSLRAHTDPLSRTEREALIHAARRVDRRLQGHASWRRRPARVGAVDLRRTMRTSVTTAGLPVAVRHRGRRCDAARLVVLVDVSLSVRGTSRLVLHLVHRLRSSVGSLRAFGFVDSFVPIDRALRTQDPANAIEAVLGLVDVHANSDPGRALRRWWSTWHYLVDPSTHVMILSDGRCNGQDPAFGTVQAITARSASTTWISPEPRGAWTLGRGEMEEYAKRVDRAVTVRSFEDLDRLVE